MLPNIEDSGRDVHDIAHLLDHSPPGTWAWFLANAAHSIRVIPDMAPERSLNAIEGGEQPLPAFVPDSLSTHADGDTDV